MTIPIDIEVFPDRGLASDFCCREYSTWMDMTAAPIRYRIRCGLAAQEVWQETGSVPIYFTLDRRTLPVRGDLVAYLDLPLRGSGILYPANTAPPGGSHPLRYSIELGGTKKSRCRSPG